jgi:polysaccharide biosynthesis/export protein
MIQRINLWNEWRAIMQLHLNEAEPPQREKPTMKPWSSEATSKYMLIMAILIGLLSSASTIVAKADETTMAYDQGSTYVLHMNDQLNITVMGHDDYSKTVTILSDGTFAYPILGNVLAAGKTVAQLTDYMERGLSKELNEPLVTISISSYFAPQLSIVGAVAKAGTLVYVPDWHILDAIAAAGGLAVLPGAANILVVRPGSGLISVDAVKLMNGSDGASNIPVYPGDSILVQQKDADELAVQVSGEVKTPGSYPVPPGGETALEAMNDAGGPLDDGGLQEVKLSHAGHTVVVDLSASAQSLDSGSLPTVMPGDQMFVPVNPYHIIIMGAVGLPQEYYIPEGKTLTLTDAIAHAGGIGGNGDIKKITVERQVDGKPVSYSIDLGKVFRGGDQSQNIVLQPGDIVYVPQKGLPANNSAYLFGLGSLVNILR